MFIVFGKIMEICNDNRKIGKLSKPENKAVEKILAVLYYPKKIVMRQLTIVATYS